MRPYRPTKADLAYRDAASGQMDPFDEARHLKSISHEYLAALVHDNAGPTSAGFKAMLDAEISRRGYAAARRANWISLGSALVALAALAVAIGG